MSSFASSQTESAHQVDELNEARIQEDFTQSISKSSTESKDSKRSNKRLPEQFENTFDYRQSISRLIKSLQEQQMMTTPSIKKQHKKQVDLTKTMTIKGKKGKLYEDICPVCLAQFQQCSGVLQCRHKFCFNCIYEWAKTSTNCPCCRKKFIKITKIKQNEVQEIPVQQKQMVYKEEDYFLCYVCGRGDNENVLLICDNCDFYCCHIYCDHSLNNTIPEGDWFCRNCTPQNELEQFINISGISSITEQNNQKQQQQQQEDKPVAARTRSRIEEPEARIFRRLRRRR